MRLKYAIISLILLSQSTFAGNVVDNFTKNALLQNANVSLLVKDLSTNKTLCDYRSTNSTIPASTLKVVTTATALEMFGPDFRFETKLAIDGVIDSKGTLNGNLIIRGGGDPTLGSDKLGEKDFLPKWVEAVKAAGIKSINGRIIADESIFEQQVINPKWTWEDMGNYYAPGIHGISYLDNTFKAVFHSGGIGTIPEIIRIEPEISGLTIENHLTSTVIAYDNAYFYGAPYSNVRTLFGEIPAERDEFSVKGDIPNPGLLLAQHFKDVLFENGIIVSEFSSIQTTPGDEGRVIYTFLSPALREIISETNVKSNNHFAEYLFKYIGTNGAKVGTNNNAIRNIRAYWKEKGLPVEQLFQYDGSGLSPVDAVSANFFVELLIYMKSKSPYAADFYKSLPVTGEKEGTLSSLLDNTVLEGKVHAKSGTIERVKCYTGYVELKNRTLVFAIQVNNANGSSKAVVKKIEEFLLQLTVTNKK